MDNNDDDNNSVGDGATDNNLNNNVDNDGAMDDNDNANHCSVTDDNDNDNGIGDGTTDGDGNNVLGNDVNGDIQRVTMVMTMATARQMKTSMTMVAVRWTMMTTTRMAKTARATAQRTMMDAWMIGDWMLTATANRNTRVGKRKDGCNKTKIEEEETVADLMVIHTTIKQIMGRGVEDGEDYDYDKDTKGSSHCSGGGAISLWWR